MKTITPLETSWRGYRFRSRLEARWAVFFDALELEWIYEPDGFELPSGRKYLPDFLLSGSSKYFWIEIKPYFYEQEALSKLFELSELTQTWGALVYGKPENPLGTDVITHGAKVIYPCETGFTMVDDEGTSLTWWAWRLQVIMYGDLATKMGKKYEDHFQYMMDHAYEAACSKRFGWH